MHAHATSNALWCGTHCEARHQNIVIIWSIGIHTRSCIHLPGATEPKCLQLQGIPAVETHHPAPPDNSETKTPSQHLGEQRNLPQCKRLNAAVEPLALHKRLHFPASWTHLEQREAPSGTSSSTASEGAAPLPVCKKDARVVDIRKR